MFLSQHLLISNDLNKKVRAYGDAVLECGIELFIQMYDRDSNIFTSRIFFLVSQHIIAAFLAKNVDVLHIYSASVS